MPGGDPATAIPQKGSPRNKKWTYGESPKVELSTTGSVKSSDGWERPPGKITSNHKLWIPGSIPLSVDRRAVDTSMVKAMAAFLCHLGWPKNSLETPLAFLAGDDCALQDMQPTPIGVPNPSMFARVWVFAPPSIGSQTVYGVVGYGPIGNLYALVTLPPGSLDPFCFELKAYQRAAQHHYGQYEYLRWHEMTREDLASPPEDRFIGFSGPYVVKQSAASSLVKLEVSPALDHCNPRIQVPIDPLELTHGLVHRFDNWLMSIRSEETHVQFLADARKLDATHARTSDG